MTTHSTTRTILALVATTLALTVTLTGCASPNPAPLTPRPTSSSALATASPTQTTTSASGDPDEAYNWAKGRPPGPAAKPSLRLKVVDGRVVVDMPGGRARMPRDVKGLIGPYAAAGGVVYEGINGTWTGGGPDRAGVLLYVSASGRVRVLARVRAIFALRVSPDGTKVVFSADKESPETKPYVHDQVQIVDVRTGATSEVAVPASLVDGDPVAWTPAGVVFLSPSQNTTFAMTYDVGRRSWQRGTAAAYLGLASGGRGEASRLVVVVKQGGARCAYLMDGGLTKGPALGCADEVFATVSAGGQWVSVALDHGDAEPATHRLFALTSATPVEVSGPPFGLGLTGLRWESGTSLVGIAESSAGEYVGFRFDAAKTEGERLAAVPSLKGMGNMRLPDEYLRGNG